MTTALFIELVSKVGVPAAEYLYGLYISKGSDSVSEVELEQLRELANYTSHDALNQAGIEIINGKVVRKQA